MEVFLFRQSEKIGTVFSLSPIGGKYSWDRILKIAHHKDEKKEKKMVSFLDFGMMTARLAI
jgi:hypothetical protein